MSIKVVNDSGVGLGTKIITDEGVDLCRLLAVESIEIEKFDAHNVIRATVILGMVKTEIKTREVKWLTKDPMSDQLEQVHSITFMNGNKFVFDECGDVKVYENNGIVELNTISDNRTMKFKSASIK